MEEVYIDANAGGETSLRRQVTSQSMPNAISLIISTPPASDFFNGIRQTLP
jgi:hypothetical protein